MSAPPAAAFGRSCADARRCGYRDMSAPLPGQCPMFWHGDHGGSWQRSKTKTDAVKDWHLKDLDRDSFSLLQGVLNRSGTVGTFKRQGGGHTSLP